MLLVKFSEDFGRHGELSGLFTCTQEEYDKVLGTNVYLGDCLGKHNCYKRDALAGPKGRLP